MADPAKSREENIPGDFYVDDTCISCGACWRLDPAHFASHEIHTFAFVCLQPVTDDERKAAEAALEICPVNAIGRRED